MDALDTLAAISSSDVPVVVATVGSIVGTASGIYALVRSFQKGRLSESAARQAALTQQAEQVMENMRANHNEQVAYYRSRIAELEAEVDRLEAEKRGTK